MSINRQAQIQHYSQEKNQYQFDLILHPPLHTKEEINFMINSLKKYHLKGQLVDYGSGAGRFTIPLLQNNFNVLSVDISAESIKTLEKRTRLLKLDKNQTFATKLPRNRKFSAIVGTDILHHIDMDEYLPRFYQALVPGGRVLFSEPNGLNIAWYIYLPFFQNWEVEKAVIYNRYFNLMTLFKRHGFKNIKITGFGFLPRPFLNFSKTLCRLNDRLGSQSFLKLFAYRLIIEAES